MPQQTISVPEKKPFGWLTAILLILPLTLLGGIIILFLNTDSGLELAAPVPIKVFAKRIILKPSVIDIPRRKSGLEEVTLAQVAITEVIWPFSRSPEITIPRLGEATIHLDYEWSASEPNGQTFWSFTLIGIYVGIIPIYLGVLWFPALRQLSRRWMVFLLAVTAGLLLFLGVDTLAQVLKRVEDVPGPFDRVGLVDISAVSIFLLLKMISKSQMSGGRSETSQGLKLAYLIATGVGLHNLGEGLVIGVAYELGEISLGAVLIVGYIIQNIAKGMGIIAPILRDRPRLTHLAILGLVGGAPAVVGAWLGRFTPSPTLVVLFPAIGAGAIFQVASEFVDLIRKDTAQESLPLTIFAGVVAGMLFLGVIRVFLK